MITQVQICGYFFINLLIIAHFFLDGYTATDGLIILTRK